MYLFSFQFIIGLGIPVDLSDVAVTVGTVIKFQYDLPLNSTEYTSRIYGFSNTITRGMSDNPDIVEDDQVNEIDAVDGRGSADENIIDDDENIYDSNENGTFIDEDPLVNITFDETRKRRSIVYGEGGSVSSVEIGDGNTELTLEEAIKRQEEIDGNYVEEEPQRMNRWDFYKILEHMSER
jgi:hypothetical protein